MRIQIDGGLCKFSSISQNAVKAYNSYKLLKYRLLVITI